MLPEMESLQNIKISNAFYPRMQPIYNFFIISGMPQESLIFGSQTRDIARFCRTQIALGSRRGTYSLLYRRQREELASLRLHEKAIYIITNHAPA